MTETLNRVFIARDRFAMKLLFAILVFIWVLSGLIGAWRLGELDTDHLKEIARGPITLADALDEYPVTYPD